MKRKSIMLVAVIFTIFATSLSWGATLAAFNFTGEFLDNSAPSITGITVTNVSSGSAFNSFAASSGFDQHANISGASAFFSGATSQATAGNALVFTITAASGYEFSLTGFSFNARSTSTSPADIGFMIGSSFYDFSSSFSNDSNITTISNFSLGLTGLTSVTISIQGWNASGAGALRLDDLVATGTVIPESSAALLGGLGLLTYFRRRR